jgi:hypothetical protein
MLQDGGKFSPLIWLIRTSALGDAASSITQVLLPLSRGEE